jgi:hypothetical protein
MYITSPSTPSPTLSVPGSSPDTVGALFTNGHDHNHFPAIARPPMDSLI